MNTYSSDAPVQPRVFRRRRKALPTRRAGLHLEQRLERRGHRGGGAEQHHQRCAAPAQRLPRSLRLAHRLARRR